MKEELKDFKESEEAKDSNVFVKESIDLGKRESDQSADFRLRCNSLLAQVGQVLLFILGLVNGVVGVAIPLFFIFTLTLESSPIFLMFSPLIVFRIATPLRSPK